MRQMPISIAGKAKLISKCVKDTAADKILCLQGAKLKAFVLWQSIQILRKQMSYKGTTLEVQSLSFHSSSFSKINQKNLYTAWERQGMMLWAKSWEVPDEN